MTHENFARPSALRARGIRDPPPQKNFDGERKRPSSAVLHGVRSVAEMRFRPCLEHPKHKNVRTRRPHTARNPTAKENQEVPMLPSKSIPAILHNRPISAELQLSQRRRSLCSTTETRRNNKT